MSLPQPDEDLLQLVDDQWKAGCIPDIQFVISRVSSGAPGDVIPELVMMDMEWRWRSGKQKHYLILSDYERLLQPPLPLISRARILCREFGIRNRWGDYVSRKELCERHPDLRDLFIRFVDHEIRDIAEWPTISIIQDDQTIVSRPLDRLVTAGRQASPNQKPWSIQTYDFSHHLVLCEMLNPSLSREQLEIRMRPDHQILIQNTSRSRSIAIPSSRLAINAGQTHICGMTNPIRIHLFGGNSLLIQKS